MTFTTEQLVAMFPHLSFDMECEFVFDDAGFALAMRGYYEVNEMRALLRCLDTANTVYTLVPRTEAGIAALIYSHKPMEQYEPISFDNEGGVEHACSEEAHCLFAYMEVRYYSNHDHPGHNMNTCRIIASRIIAGEY